MKIVSLTPVATETLVLLGLEDELVGITPYCRLYLERPGDKTIVGTCLTVRMDKLEKLRPDLVITQEPVQNEITMKLAGKGYNVYKVRAHTSIPDIIATVIDIGVLTGRYVEAKNLVAELTGRYYRLLEETMRLSLSERPRVYVDHFWSYDNSTTVGGLSYVDDGVWSAGGVTLYHEVPKGFFEPDYEDVVKRDPDIIIVSVEPYYKLTPEKYAEKRPQVKRSRAYKEGRILVVEEGRKVNLNHPGPSFIDTIEYLHDELKRLYPPR